MSITTIYSKFLNSSGISTDTRNIKKGSIFFALKGEKFNANSFAEDALSKGAKYVVIDDENYVKDNEAYVLVTNVLETLQELAAYHRKQLKIPIIALTGSNGKTTTKELVHRVLSKKYKTTATVGNLNNHIGVPLTLLTMTKDTEIGIVEMGANHFDEIAFLCKIATPDYGYITNFGKAHLEGFGDIEGVIKAKSELYDFLKKNNGIAFVNKDDSVQLNKTTFQKRELLGDTIQLVDTTDFISVKWNSMKINTKLVGFYNFPNVVAAIGIGAFFKVEKDLIKEGIESYIPNNKRSQLIQKKDTQFLLDAYNANPTSMQVALENFGKKDTSQKIVILGDMFELGESSDKEHKQIANLVKEYNFKHVFLIGKEFSKMKLAHINYYKDFDSFKADFKLKNFKGHTILIKASRGMALERIIDLFD